MAASDTALEWWDRFCTQASLELRAGRNKPARDEDLEDALLMPLLGQLSPPPQRGYMKLRDLLRDDAKASAPQITTPHFLEMVRASLRDFGGMVADILDTLACAQTQRGAHTLSLVLRLAEDDTVVTRERLQQHMDTIRQALDTRIAPSDPRAQGEWTAEIGGRLLDVLTLPLWRARPTLYVAWAGTRLLRAARDHADSFHFHTYQIHPHGHMLPFTPTGVRLATYEYGGEQFDIWAEMQTVLRLGHGKRKRGVHPDFRVVQATLDVNSNVATRFVLECQHWREYDMDNMLRTFGDYVQGCPNAEPLLVYRRPAGAIEMFRPGMAARTPYLHALTDVTVTRERQHHTLYDGIRNILFAGAPSKATALPTDDTVETPAPVPAAPPRASDALREDLAATVLLEWTDALQDVDLRLVLINDGKNPQTVAYDHTGSLAEAPYAQLVQDVVTGPGQEVIEISRWGNASYLISVRNFSQTGALALDTVACRIRIQGGATWVLKPGHPRDYEWTVGTITVVGDEIHMVPYAGETVLSS